jgi:hypothetical protein
MTDDVNRLCEFSKTRSLFATQSLSYFANLTTLEIRCIHGDLSKSRKYLVQVLLNSPNLESLSLSISADTIRRLEKVGSNDHTLFLVSLIQDFVQVGGKPLRLKKLILGLAVIPRKSRHSLQLLIDLTCLEEVHVENALWFFDSDEYIVIDWEVFTPAYCPNLSSFSVYSLQDIIHAIKRGLGSLKQVGIHVDTRADVNGTMLSSAAKQQLVSHETRALTLINLYNKYSGLDPLESMLNSIYFLSVLQSFGQSRNEWLSNIIYLAQRAPHLKQLFLAGVRSQDVECTEFLGYEVQCNEDIDSWGWGSGIGLPEVGSPQYQIAHQCKNLSYIRIDNCAWRVLRDCVAPETISFERLDRFEAREIEAFQPWNIFHFPEI